MQTFYSLLVSSLIVSSTNNFVWFALTYWIYLETKSVISTGVVAGTWLAATAVSGFWLGSLVDHHQKKIVMLASSLVTLIFYIISFFIYTLSPAGSFNLITNPMLWVLVLTIMVGVIAGNVYGIAIPTLVTILVPEDKRDKANGLLGTIFGVSFAITSVASGLILAFAGMSGVLLSATFLTLVGFAYLVFIKIPEKKIIHSEENQQRQVDLTGTIKVVSSIPGLFALIFYTSFNNFLMGVFMALMDAYGLSMVSVQTWGILWGFLSLGFVLGGFLIVKKGLGKNPLRTLFLVNIVNWIVCIIFPIQQSIVLLFIGCLLWLTLMPYLEAVEQTIIQKVVPLERQGRVFGFAQSVEQAVSPISAFMMGPIAQLVFIPFMTTGVGVNLIGEWFGVGEARGIALTFIFSGIVGSVVTLFAMYSRSAKLLSIRYLKG
jgi:MFS transporter, DHA3 family, multidrug efflux protein